MANNDFGFCSSWPTELQELESKRYRLSMKIQCLENNIKRADFSEFEDLMYELEKATQEMHKIGLKRIELIRKYNIASTTGNGDNS